MRTFESLDALVAAKGEVLGTSSWVEITQEAVNLFADATGDHQWIHVDVEKAKSGPFGGTIAHGFMTLSLIPRLMHEMYTVGGIKLAINYGLNKTRFPAPVPSGSRVRAVCTLQAADVISPNTLQLTEVVTMEVEGQGKPACVAEAIMRVGF